MTSPRHRWAACGLAFLTVSLAALNRAAAQVAPDSMDRAEELRLAMSAAPRFIHMTADVYVLSRHGFDLAIDGPGPWSCLVVRGMTDPSALAPMCLDRHATKTVLPTLLRRAALRSRGMTPHAVAAEVSRQFGSGELPLPSGPAYAYMLSDAEFGSTEFGQSTPQVLLFLPYATNDEVGGDPGASAGGAALFPYIGPLEGHPLSALAIPTQRSVSPRDVRLPVR